MIPNSVFPTSVCKRFAIVLILFGLLDIRALGQEKQTVYGNQQWIQYYLHYDFNENWKTVIDGGFRWEDKLESSSQHHIRGGVFRKLEGRLNIGGGLAHLGFYGGDELVRREMRLYQQLTKASRIGNMDVKHRVRSEQRFFNAISTEEREFGWRLRYRFLMDIPLLSLHKGGYIAFSIGDEVLVNAMKNDTHQFLDHNRLLAGPVWTINESTDVQLLANFVCATTSSQSISHFNSVIWLGVVNRF